MADDIAHWLERHGLGQYAPAFADQDIDLEVLPHLRDEDLERLGLSLGHMRKLQAAVAQLAAGGRQSVAAKRAVPEANGASGERRRVTIVFIDVADFTRISSTADPEDVHALLGTYFETVDRVVLDHGGHIDKHMGDAVMAVFGAPVSHGNDAERAVRAAFAIHEALDGLDTGLESEIRAHIGVATGEVVASGTGSSDYQEYTMTGDSVNLAARLDGMADPGETLVSDAVYREVADLIECERLDEVSVKGLDRPIRVWRLLSLHEQRSGAASAPFVGRRSELAQFAAVIAACRDTRAGQVLLVRGDAGIGKTRLVEEFHREAHAHGWRTDAVRILDFGVGGGRDPMTELARSLLGASSDGAGRDNRNLAERLIASESFEPAEQVFLNDLLDLPRPPEMRTVLDVVDTETRNRGKREVLRRLVRRASDEMPVLLTIEDLHWADPLTLEHLAAVALVTRECRAVIVMTTRADGDPIDQAWRSRARGVSLNTVDLSPLRRDEAEELAQAIIGADDRAAADCIERADGNPLFLEQLLRDAAEGNRAEVPGSIQSLILMRMDRLSPVDKGALQAASVIGQRFDLATLRCLLDDPAYECAALVEHVLVRPDDDAYLFAHALVRDGAYASLLRPRKRALHRLAADWFSEKDPVLTAEHLDRADDPEAPRAYLDAARYQAKAYRHEHALELAERGLELASEHEDLFGLMCFRGETLNDLGAIRESIDAYEAAVPLAMDDVHRCTVWLGLAAGMRITERTEDAVEALDKAEAAATASSLTRELSRIHHVRGNVFFPVGNIDGCLAEHELALRFARDAGSVEDEVRALGGLGDAYFQRGRMITAYNHFDRCVETAIENGFGAIEVANQPLRGWTRVFQLDLSGALEDGRVATERALKVGHQRAETTARFCQAIALYEMSRYAQAREEIEHQIRLSNDLGMRRHTAASLSMKARILEAEGLPAEALEIANHALDICRESAMPFAGPRVWSAIALATDDAKPRRQALAEGEKLLTEGAHSISHFWFLRDAIESSLRNRDWGETERYAASMKAYTRPEPLPWSDFFVARGLALAAHGRGRRDDPAMAELGRLRAEAGRVGLEQAMPALDAALAAGAR